MKPGTFPIPSRETAGALPLHCFHVSDLGRTSSAVDLTTVQLKKKAWEILKAFSETRLEVPKELFGTDYSY